MTVNQKKGERDRGGQGDTFRSKSGSQCSPAIPVAEEFSEKSSCGEKSVASKFPFRKIGQEIAWGK